MQTPHPTFLRLAACTLAVGLTAACARSGSSGGTNTSTTSSTTTGTTGTATTGAGNPSVPSATGGEVTRPGVSSGGALGGAGGIRGGGMATGR